MVVLFLTGNVTILDNEIYRQEKYGKVLSRFRATGATNTPGMTKFDRILVNETHSLISLVTMIFPSPDWFLGISNMDMCNKVTGEWRESYTRDLLPYDSGTDDGTSFESPNSVTKPRKNIFLIGNRDKTNFKSDSDIRRLGVLVMQRFEEKEVDIVNNNSAASTFMISSILVALTTTIFTVIMQT